MNALDKRGHDLLAEVWNDIQKMSQAREVENIKADPDKHRLTRIMGRDAHTGYTYYSAGMRKINRKRKDHFRFCVATHKNAAGVFLIWRQVDQHKLVRGHWTWFETERFNFQWSPSKREARDIARKKAERYKLDLQHDAAAKLPHAPADVYAMVNAAINS